MPPAPRWPVSGWGTRPRSRRRHPPPPGPRPSGRRRRLATGVRRRSTGSPGVRRANHTGPGRPGPRAASGVRCRRLTAPAAWSASPGSCVPPSRSPRSAHRPRRARQPAAGARDPPAYTGGGRWPTYDWRRGRSGAPRRAGCPASGRSNVRPYRCRTVAGARNQARSSHKSSGFVELSQGIRDKTCTGSLRGAFSSRYCPATGETTWTRGKPEWS
jgi:hypothetical protein